MTKQKQQTEKAQMVKEEIKKEQDKAKTYLLRTWSECEPESTNSDTDIEEIPAPTSKWMHKSKHDEMIDVGRENRNLMALAVEKLASAIARGVAGGAVGGSVAGAAGGSMEGAAGEAIQGITEGIAKGSAEGTLEAKFQKLEERIGEMNQRLRDFLMRELGSQ